ncbi:MAG: hypothetical protein A4E71_01033 [Smithella sp. PtaU1.Bin162]|nr:MAG: hypothetical protein A4E71_01033 [Smithella sp. PtaU1.Bin162]
MIWDKIIFILTNLKRMKTTRIPPNIKPVKVSSFCKIYMIVTDNQIAHKNKKYRITIIAMRHGNTRKIAFNNRNAAENIKQTIKPNFTK